MTFEELKAKAHSLPYSPGVYIMRDKSDTVIYVGKAKKLKNRVSQYFQDTASHTAKTRRMVSQIDHFDTIIAGSEFEALVLECSLIKHHMPRYNILLKDDKGYPYLRIDWQKPYPVLSLVGRVSDDGAEYFGPYGGRYVTQKVIDTIRLALKLPDCSSVFPRDIGKKRPCLNAHIGNCDGWCKGTPNEEEYRARMHQAADLLRGKHREVLQSLQNARDQAAEELRFEEAAILRDRIKAVESLAQKQIVTHGVSAQTDAIGYYENESKCGFAVLHFVDGNLLDKEYQILPRGFDANEMLSAFVKQYYVSGLNLPKVVLLPFDVEDAALFSELLAKEFEKKVQFRVPRRGDGAKWLALANENARQETERVTSREEKLNGTLVRLGELLGLNVPPMRIEAYDISNTAGKDIVASMTVFVDGKPLKKDYRLFKIRGLADQDDYESMRQVITRRLTHLKNGDAGFADKPDLLLIDGGTGQVACAIEAQTALGLTIPTYGMVKDDRHRTRALVAADGSEIAISGTPSLFAMIGRIQEETHRFAITYHRKLQSDHLKKSGLEQIEGIGPKRREQLLKAFRSLKNIRAASVRDLRSVLTEKQAQAVYAFYHEKEQKA